MSITFDHSAMDPELGLNLSNANAIAVLVRLGIVVDHCGEIDSADLIRRCDEALHEIELDSILDAGIAPTSDRGRRGATLVDYGVRPGYYADRIGELREIAVQAHSLGLPVGWA